ncbi:MAG: hypothetical protein ACR2L2_01615 [Acidobacteriota bacterium]
MLFSPVLAPGMVFAQLVADPDFNTTVARPAYVKTHPKVLIDEAHANFHTAAGRYKPLADLLSNDGYQVTPLKDKFSVTALKGYHVLVIANALGAGSTSSREWSRDWFEAGAKPAFSEQECDDVREWIHAGGALLLIADHRPFGAAAEILAQRFAVEMSQGYVFDTTNLDTKGDYRNELTFTRENGGLADHPVTQGRDETERINRVMTFVGQSLRGPAGSAAFLRLADTAIDRQDLATSTPEVSAAGRSQGIAMKFGKGRVVILGEAAMLSAQVPLGSKEKEKFGMNAPGIDNRQLALNIMHWLSGLLD